MKVYVLTYPEYAEGNTYDRILGIYTSEEKAKQAIKDSRFSEEDKKLCDISCGVLNERW